MFSETMQLVVEGVDTLDNREIVIDDINHDLERVNSKYKIDLARGIGDRSVMFIRENLWQKPFLRPGEKVKMIKSKGRLEGIVDWSDPNMEKCKLKGSTAIYNWEDFIKQDRWRNNAKEIMEEKNL